MSIYKYKAIRKGADGFITVIADNLKEAEEEAQKKAVVMGATLTGEVEERKVEIPKEPFIEIIKRPRLRIWLQYRIVHTSILWKRRDKASSVPRWNWVDRLLYWLEGLR